MSTKGCADVVFCLDASQSMKPCFEAVRKHITDFMAGLKSRGQMVWDLRVDFVAHAAGTHQGGILFRSISLYNDSLHDRLYKGGQEAPRFFTSDVAEVQAKLATIVCEGDEAPLIGLDFALDFPWRPASSCHRVIIMLTDEAMETGVLVPEQRAMIPKVIDKIQKLRVMLYMVGPQSHGFEQLATVDKAEYQPVDVKGDGLAGLDFKEVLGYIGKSVSASSLQMGSGDTVEKGLFGQSSWGTGTGTMGGN